MPSAAARDTPRAKGQTHRAGSSFVLSSGHLARTIQQKHFTIQLGCVRILSCFLVLLYSNTEQCNYCEDSRKARHHVPRLRGFDGRQKCRSHKKIGEQKGNPPEIWSEGCASHAAFPARAPSQPDSATRQRHIQVPQHRKPTRDEYVSVGLFPLFAERPE